MADAPPPAAVIPPPPRWLAPAALALIGIVLAWRLADFGITWDEQVQHHYGQLVLDYFLSGGQDLRCLEYKNLYLYGPLWELLAAALERLSGADRYLLRHGLTLLAASLAGVAVWRLASRWPNPWAAPLAVAALFLLPRWLGDSAGNSKDVPFAAAFALTLLAGERWLMGPRAWTWRAALLGGLALGVLLAIRVGGVLVLGPLGLLLLWRVWSLGGEAPEAASHPGVTSGWWRLLAGGRAVPRRAWGQMAMILPLGWLLMVLAWPWAQRQPLMGPWQALRETGQFSATYPVLYAGQTLASDQLPRSYLPWYLTMSTPPVLLALALLGLGVLVWAWRSRAAAQPAALAVLVWAWLALPLGMVLWRRPPLYDGLRHALFLLPALALAAGVGAAALLAWLGQRSRRPWLALAVTLGCLLSPLPALWRLHPYQYTYFSPLMGGLAAAEGRYETDYWAASYSEAGRWLAARAVAAHRPLVVIVAANENLLPALSHHLPPERVELHLVWTGREPLPASWDYFVGLGRYGQRHRFPAAPIIHQIGRDGAIFTVIRAGNSSVMP